MVVCKKKVVLALILAALIAVQCGREVPAFDGDRAFAYLLAQTDFGPRNPGSEGHRECLEYLVEELSKTADLVKIQPFSFTDQFIDSTFAMTNIIASFNMKPPEGRRILLAAHWDTRPRADEDPESKNNHTPILGANDGASGVAVLLETAAIMKRNPPPIGVDIILFDGEDYGIPEINGLDYYFLGSKHFAETKGSYQPEYAILLDMVGSKNSLFYIEGHSFEYAPLVVERIWNKAHELNFSAFVQEIGPSINDDHLILNRAGIPSVDIIDINDFRINYQQWHTLADTPEQCSPVSLTQVGALLIHIIYD